jgi:hypothetical protein
MTKHTQPRRMWMIYKKLLVEDGMSRRDEVLAQAAFYSGARGVLRVLDHLVETGDIEELQARHSRPRADYSRATGADAAGAAAFGSLYRLEGSGR